MKDSSRLFISSAVGTFIYLFSQTTTASSYLTHAQNNRLKDNSPLPYRNENRPVQPKQPAVIPRRDVSVCSEEQDTSLTIPPNFYRNNSGNPNLEDAEDKFSWKRKSFLNERGKRFP